MGDSRSRNVSQARSSVNGATGNRPAGRQDLQAADRDLREYQENREK